MRLAHQSAYTPRHPGRVSANSAHSPQVDDCAHPQVPQHLGRVHLAAAVQGTVPYDARHRLQRGQSARSSSVRPPNLGQPGWPRLGPCWGNCARHLCILYSAKQTTFARTRNCGLPNLKRSKRPCMAQNTSCLTISQVSEVDCHRG